MHAVVFNLQIGDAGTFAFARFEFDKKSAAIFVDAAQLIEFGVKARGDDPAFAQQRRRFGQDGADQQVLRCFRRRHVREQFVEQGRR